MSPPAAEVHRLSPGLAIWHRYDAQVKADLFSTCAVTSSGAYLVDPIALDKESLTSLTAGPIAGIVVTNANHLRAAQFFSEHFAATIYAGVGAQTSSSVPISHGDDLAGDLQVIAIEGAAPGEIALYWKGERGTFIIGDALINFGAHAFTFLPGKYCSNPKLMRKSLRNLLQFSFDRLLFAHGQPIMTQARERLETLLAETE